MRFSKNMVFKLTAFLLSTAVKVSLERESSKFFQIPKPLSRGRARNFSKSQSLYSWGGVELGIIPSIKAALKRESSEFFRAPKVSLERESSEFFQIPEPLSRGRARNFSKSQSLYSGGGENSEFFQVSKPL